MFKKNHVFMLLVAGIVLSSCSGSGEKREENDLETDYETLKITDEDDFEETTPKNVIVPNDELEAAAPQQQEENNAVSESETNDEPLYEETSSSATTSSSSLSEDEMLELSGQLRVNVEENDDIELFKEAASWIGVPYLYAGTNKRGVDASAFIDAIYVNVYGKVLGRRFNEIYDQCNRIDKKDAKSGDIVFFHTNGKVNETPNFAGIYLKDNMFIVTTTKKGVTIESLTSSYYKNNFVCFGRVK